MYTVPRYTNKQKIYFVKRYYREKTSLRESARTYGLSYLTLWRWIKKYKFDGEEAFNKPRRKSNKRMPIHIENEIMLLKERNPGMSINKTRKYLKKQGINISIKGIWNVWARNGLIYNENIDLLDPFYKSTPEVLEGVTIAKQCLDQGKIHESAETLNRLPSMTRDDVLLKVPEKLLSPRRKLERFYLESENLPFLAARKKAHQLSLFLENKGYIYSSILANFMELLFLNNMGLHYRMHDILQKIGLKLGKMHHPTWRYLHCLFMVLYYSRTGNNNKAYLFSKKIRNILRSPIHPWYYMTLGSMYTFLGKYRESFFYYKKGFEVSGYKELNFALDMVLHGYCQSGDYHKAQRLLKIISKSETLCHSSMYYLSQAYVSLGRGKLKDAGQYFLQVMNTSTKYNLTNHVKASHIGLAMIANALNSKSEALSYLCRSIKYQMSRGNTAEINETKLFLSLLRGKNFPVFDMSKTDRLFYYLFLAKKDKSIRYYKKALHFARKNELMGFFERMILLSPEPVCQMIECGQNPGISNPILRLPLFNQKKHIYKINFMGDLIVLKNQQVISVILSPKEKAFLIHLALRLPQPGSCLPLEDIFGNFWPHSKYQLIHLLHMLTSIRKKLKIWRNLLSVKTYKKSNIINRGIYFMTDFDDLKTLLIQACSFEKAENWKPAIDTYYMAKKLYRGSLFKKMYDNWSEEIRGYILNQVGHIDTSIKKLRDEHPEILIFDKKT